MRKPALQPRHPELKAREKEAQRKSAQQTRRMSDNLSEEQLDKALKDTFPASDPPGTY